MITFQWLIGLLLGAVLLSALARRMSVPYPTFLAIGGMLLAFVPSGPSWTLDPDLALALFVAPVLLDAAYDTSLRDLRDNWLPITMLVFVAVGITTAAVASLVHWLQPDMPWAAAIALGALPGFDLPGDLGASDRYFVPDLTSPHVLVDGELLVPDGPGLGMALDEEAIARAAIRTESFSVSRP